MKNDVMVSIGLPVYNGENYIEDALKSIVGQTYRNLEIFISDNASTDNTAEICREFASRDRRIKYCRQKENIGAAKNYNVVYRLSKGKYFKWSAHDDIIEPTYIERCVCLLEKEPDAVLCHSISLVVDEFGKTVEYDHSSYGTSLENQIDRFYARLRARRCLEVFGVIRSNCLYQTELIGPFAGSDRTLLVDLVLRGRFLLVPEPLFINRDHPNRSVRLLKSYEQLHWYAPHRIGRFDCRTWILYQRSFIFLSRQARGKKEFFMGCVAMLKSIRYHGRWLLIVLQPLIVLFPRLAPITDRLKIVRQNINSFLDRKLE